MRTTLYVADEGSGNTTDTTVNAGLEKWSLVNGTWELDYMLQTGLIGDSYNVAGWRLHRDRSAACATSPAKSTPMAR